MKQFENGDRVRLTIQDKKVQGCPGVVTKVDNNKIQVVLELWCRWGTFSNYFPLWFTEDQLEKV